MALRLGALCLVLHLGTSAAMRGPPRLKYKVLPAHLPTNLHDSQRRNGTTYRQVMNNFMDLQYYISMQLGGQVLQGIVDTGSFELVVFSRNCQSCGMAGHFSENNSTTYSRGQRLRTHAYGSGDCSAYDAIDNLTVGPLAAPRQGLWLAQTCSMPLLKTAAFHAIVGIGPPGQPAYTAKSTLNKIQEMERTYSVRGEKPPKDMQLQMQEAQQDLDVSLQTPSLLQNFGVNTFSTCFGRSPGSPAWLVWNDTTRAGVPGVSRVQVAGNITWSAVVERVALGLPGGQDVVLNCNRGSCVAILDTGSSLIGVPTETIKLISKALEAGPWDLDCTNLAGLPDLLLNLGGSAVRLPPSSYVGRLYGSMSKDVADMMRESSLGKADHAGTKCSLLLMDAGSEMTPFGPMYILGMPFFREYYTTFDLGTGRGNRSLYLSRASEECEPELKAESLRSVRIRSRDQVVARQIDASKLRVPHWLRNRRGNTIP